MIARAQLVSVARATAFLVLALVPVGAAHAAEWRGSPRPAPPPPPPPPAAPAFGGPQTLWVSSERPEPVWTAPLANGMIYTIEVSGTFSIWPDQREGVDAYYGYSPRVGPRPQPWNQLLVDDRPLFEIARGHGHPVWYNPAHAYTTSIRGRGRPVKLQILDARNGSWRDNHGSLSVRIAPQAAYVPPPPPPPPPGPPPPPPGGWRGSPMGGPFIADEVVTVPADRPEPVFTRGALAPGVFYTLEISGVFSFKRGPWDGADAFFSYSGGRRRARGSEFRPQLLVDDRSAADLARDGRQPLAYSPSHTYLLTIRGRGQPLKLQTLDARNGSWHDNQGGLTVRIRRR